MLIGMPERVPAPRPSRIVRPAQHPRSRQADSATGPQVRAPETTRAGPMLQLQQSVGNAAAAATIQRAHPAFERQNFWAPSRPTLTEDGELDWSQPAPQSPDGVLARLVQTFSAEVARLLLLTDASGQEALDREPMTRGFLDEWGTMTQAAEILEANPADNAQLAAAYAQQTAVNRAMVARYLNEGGTKERADAIVGPTVEDLQAALNEDLVALMRERTQHALARLDALDQIRTLMQSDDAARPEGLSTVRAELIEAKSALRVTDATSRAAWRVKFENATRWCADREAALAPIPEPVRRVTGAHLRMSYRQLPTIDALLFGRPDAFDASAFDNAWKQWADDVPVKRLRLKSPAELRSDLEAKIGALWPTADPGGTGRLATLLLSQGKSELVTVLTAGAVTLATWTNLNHTLEGAEVFDAVEALRTEAELLALIRRVNLTAHTGAHLTQIAITEDLADVHHGRAFTYMGGGQPAIETELSVTWKSHLWMPKRLRHWGEIHIHYGHRVADPSQITYAHVKTDRAMDGGTPIATAHPLIAKAYADGKLSAEWRI